MSAEESLDQNKTDKDKMEDRDEIDVATNELNGLYDQLDELHETVYKKEVQLQDMLTQRAATTEEAAPVVKDLSAADVERYSRQLLLPGFGVGGQQKLKKQSFLIVGVGGLGCPAAQYLVSAGAGRIGLVDYDRVDRSNLHRQTLHTEPRIGMSKVESASVALALCNRNCRIEQHHMQLESSNALEVIGNYDIVLDCTDNVATRYLLNDACVMLNKPLVSGSALQLDGQLTVYNYGDAPCYRCLFPVPPPPEAVTNCSDGGVLGAITGVIGSLQALEAIKLATELGDVLAGRLLIYDGARGTFRNIKLRGRRANCDVCSETPMITHLINYEQFCGRYATDKNHPLNLLPPSHRVSASDYQLLSTQPHLLLDVRPPTEFEICRLPGALNVPLKLLLDERDDEQLTPKLTNPQMPVFVVCRRGNDSQIAVQHLRDKYPQRLTAICDIIGGLQAWHKHIDPQFPIY